MSSFVTSLIICVFYILDLPKDDLLQLLLVIAKRWENEREIMSLVLKALANVSCDPSYAEDIRSTGIIIIGTYDSKVVQKTVTLDFCKC